MFDELKYIMVNRSMPVLFSPAIEHSAMASQFLCKGDQIKSAGFVRVMPDGQVRCYGSSVSLGGISVGRHDSKIISKLLFGGVEVSEGKKEVLGLEELLKTTPESLARRQYIAIQEHVKGVLNECLGLLESDSLEALSEKLTLSPAGDGYGTEHHFINFAWSDGDEVDLMGIIEDLIKRRSKIYK